MRKSSRNTMRLFLLFVLLLTLSLTAVVAFAQEATPAAEGEAAVTVEGETAPVVEEGRNPLTPLGINTGFLLAQIVNFLLIFALLSSFLWRPLSNMLESRAVKIQQGLEDAAKAANERRNAEAEAEKILTAARADAARVIEEARARGEEVAHGVETTARTEAESIRNEARTRATEERDRQLADVRTQVAAISVALAQRLIGESLDQKRQQALINDFFAKVPADAKSLAGQSVEVVSALPLSDAEKQQIQNQIGATNVTFNVDPGILGGLVLRTEQRVVDGSVRSNLNALASRLR